MPLIRIATYATAAILLASLGGADAPRKASATDALIDAMIAQRTYHVAISPDGLSVAYTESLNDAAGVPSGPSAIYVADVAGKTRKRITAGTKAIDSLEEGDVSWSADSRALAFISNAGGREQAQVYIAGGNNWSARRLTNAKGMLSSPRFSPDGKSLAVLITENAARKLGPLAPTAPEIGVIGDEVLEQRIAIVDTTTGAMRIITPADTHVYHCSWSPDSKQLAAIAVKGSGENNYWTAGLYTVEAGGGAMRSILVPQFQLANPRWSPDGKSIAFIAGIMSDEGATGGDLYAIPAAGGEAVNLMPDLHGSIMSFDFAGDSLVFTQLNGGSFEVGSMVGGTGTPRVVGSFDEMISDGDWPAVSVARDGITSAVVRSSFQHPYEVWAGPIGAWKQLTHDNDSLHPQWGAAANLHWTNEGMRMQGWLLAPSAPSAAKSPMIVSVHGGPASMNSPAWPSPQVAALASQGYYVFLPNPRGSYGQGNEFTMANVRDFGYGDLRDILAGVDEVIRVSPVDARRIGVTGWSYGGFMTMWAVTQTGRFRAAVAGAGISNWQSYYGQNSIDQWMFPYFGASVYDDPYIYARSSAINYIKNVKTPTLVLVGERDAECPAPQSFEFYRALKRLDIPTQMVVFENEGHRISKPAHRREIARRMVEWFDKYLGR